MKTLTRRFGEYTVTLHPRHYGRGYTDDERQKIASIISGRLTREFPGLVVQISEHFGRPTATKGPDRKVIHELDVATIAALNEVSPYRRPLRLRRGRKAKKPVT